MTYSGIRAYAGYRQQATIESRGMNYNAPKPDEVEEDLEFPADKKKANPSEVG